MTEIQFFRRALWLPIVVPIIAGVFLFASLLSPLRNEIVNPFIEGVGYIAIGGAIGFLPYCVVAIPFDRYLRGQVRLDRRLLLLLPPVVASVAALLTALLGSVLTYPIFVLGCFFGYAYAAFIAILELFLRRKGVIIDERAQLPAAVAL